MKWTSLLLLLVAGGACSSSRDVAAADASSDRDMGVATLSARFVSFTSGSYSSVCSAPPCTGTLSIRADGAISDSAGHAATMSTADTATFASWAASQEAVDALQAPGCPPVIDGGSWMEVEIAPGIFTGDGSSTAGCASGPVAALGQLANLLSIKYFDGRDVALAHDDPMIQNPDHAAQVLWDSLAFSSAALSGAGSVAADGAVYGEIDIRTATAADLAQLTAQATSPALMAAWPGTCTPSASATQGLRVFLAPGIRLQTGTDGCTAGPITSLIQSLTSAIRNAGS